MTSTLEPIGVVVPPSTHVGKSLCRACPATNSMLTIHPNPHRRFATPRTMEHAKGFPTAEVASAPLGSRLRAYSTSKPSTPLVERHSVWGPPRHCG